MKRIIICFLIVLTLLSLTACGNNGAEKSSNPSSHMVSSNESSKSADTAIASKVSSETKENELADTYWTMVFGQSMGGFFDAKFNADGTIDAIGLGSQQMSKGKYYLKGQKLYITLESYKDIAFIKNGKEFRSEKKYPMQDGNNYYYTIGPTTKEAYLKLYKQCEDSSKEPEQVSSEEALGSPENPVYSNVAPLQMGEYAIESEFYGGAYAIITLKKSGEFSLKSNYDLKEFKKVKPYAKNGTFKIENPFEEGEKGSVWLVLYVNGKEYIRYFAGEDGTFFQDQSICFKKQK